MYNNKGIESEKDNKIFIILKKNDLKLKTKEKSLALEILERDIEFLSKMKSYGYSLMIFFLKHDDFDLLTSPKNLEGEISINLRSMPIEKRKDIGQFFLENKIGFACFSLLNFFRFLNEEEERKSTCQTNFNFSLINPELYGQNILEAFQNL